jgi:uncharacterized protein (DUF885 family)
MHVQTRLQAETLGLCLLVLTSIAAPACSPTGDEPPEIAPDALVGDYLQRYLETFPTQATAAGWHEADDRLEDLDADARRRWVEFNLETLELGERALAAGESLEDAYDLELLIREARRQHFELAVARRPERDPLYWTGIAGNATVFLLVREDRPLEDRLTAATSRVRALPRLLGQAREALAETDASQIAGELCAIGARQAAASATFYREGFARAAEDLDRVDLRQEAARAGERAAEALDAFAGFLRDLEVEASGSPRLGDLYPQLFAIVTGIDDPVDRVLERAEAALVAKRREAAAFGRSVWDESDLAGSAPDDDAELLRRLFERLAEDRASDEEEFFAQYRELIDASVRMVREGEIVTLPEPLTLFVDRSPSFFVGQSVGGVYPAGPFEPEADTLLFLPTPPETATREQLDAFFRDFNDHFNVMIVPHEIIPGHYLQLKYAARHPRKVRALFPDGVYVEGWGTFSERLMLDLGWGGPLDRLAHLKKQMENIARTIVDIRVHTRGMTREEVLRFVRDEALQDEQFAGNMWTRSITSAPQLTTYFLGYEQVRGLYDEVVAERGDAFVLREFTDGMMTLGPVPVRHYREMMLGHRE